MSKVTLKGKSVNLEGNFCHVGEKAPAFSLVGQDLKEYTLSSFGNTKKLLSIFPSFDTPVCSKAMHEFYTLCQEHSKLTILNISMDLPFAAKRYCLENALEKSITLSAFRSDFGQQYGVKMIDGPLKGLLARAVIGLDEEGRVIYAELVSEITHEPNYQAAFEAISQ